MGNTEQTRAGLQLQAGLNTAHTKLKAAHATKKIILIDNYDSFVHILAQYLGELGASPVVHRHDAVTVADVKAFNPDGIVISPGPGHPQDAKVSNDILLELSHMIPVFGVCLGMQCMAEVFGGKVVRAKEVMHGKTSNIHHTNTGVFKGLPTPIQATRYHSLIAERSSVERTPTSDLLEITATTDDGTIMGLRHKSNNVEGVQFHPESVLTLACGQSVLPTTHSEPTAARSEFSDTPEGQGHNMYRHQNAENADMIGVIGKRMLTNFLESL